jgi:hypothetical protein
MHFDQREQTALREAGLSTEDLQSVSDRVAALVREEAADLQAFFDAHDTLYSDMETAHSASEYQTHEDPSLDLYTHAADLRGWVRFETWGAYVEDGRTLSETIVELRLGPTVNARVKFAASPEEL